LLGLGLPRRSGESSGCAREGDPNRFHFPRPMIGDGFEFSFSGTEDRRPARGARPRNDLDRDRAALARGFQDAVLDVLVTKLERAILATGYKTAVLGGCVACSRGAERLGSSAAQRPRARGRREPAPQCRTTPR
jgi:N6-L-threonylcarbamoyladenine synthase